jgi:Outer membrane protein Omp28
MKRIGLLCCFIFLLAISFFSCDQVDDIYETPPKPVDSRRKVLVEDYTGHKCGNCPRAARVLYDSLQVAYPEQVIGIGVHAGFFAKPLPIPGIGCDTVDYRCETGNKWDSLFLVTALGNPTGMINRVDYPANDHVKYGSEWPSAVAQLLQKEADAIIEIENTYNASTRSLNITVKTDFLKSLTGTYKLVLVMTEDNIYSCQKDDDATPVLVSNYRHRHVLRGAINGNFGESISIDPQAELSVTKTFNYAVNSNWIDTNCQIVAFVFNEATYEIIQAEEHKIIQ